MHGKLAVFDISETGIQIGEKLALLLDERQRDVYKRQAWRSADETQHSVTVSNFYMSRYELTQKEYEEITGNNPSNFSGENLPVENISWLDAVAYCNARSEKDGLTRCV